MVSPEKESRSVRDRLYLNLQTPVALAIACNLNEKMEKEKTSAPKEARFECLGLSTETFLICLIILQSFLCKQEEVAPSGRVLSSIELR